jgi:hypothetical protein
MRGAHGAKAYATSAGANSTCDVSGTTEPTAGVTATTTTKSSSTAAAVPSRPRYGTERHGCGTNHQSNYLLYFHAFKFGPSLLAGDCASAGFCDTTSELVLAPSLEI